MKSIRFLLFPFAILYDVVTRIRNFMYDYKILKATSFSVPTIAVGNLSVGGTGKTPQIEYLVRLFQQSFQLAILSRGYKRKTTGFVLVSEQNLVEEVGDEPLQFYKKFKHIAVAVSESRVEGVEQLIKTNNPSMILLDDAFQHRRLKADFYILLTSYSDLFVDDYLLPTGNLRESRRGAKRANIIVVSKCPSNLSEKKQHEILRKINPLNDQTVFFSTTSYADKLKGTNCILISELKHHEVLLVTGIANPNPLVQFLEEQDVCFQHLKFSDHHDFSEQEIEKIESSFKQIVSEKKILLTTEKDYARLSSKIQNASYIEIQTSFLNGSATTFNALLQAQFS